MESSECIGGLAPGRLYLQKLQSSLPVLNKRTRQQVVLLFSLVPAQAVVSVSADRECLLLTLKYVTLPPKLKCFDRAR